MPLYTYNSVDSLGKRKRGLIDALTTHEAKEKLRQQGLTLLSLQSKAGKKRGHALRGEALATFLTQLSQLLGAGVPLYESLLSLEEQYRGDSFHYILLTLCEQIKAGSSLCKAMEQFPQSFDRLTCAMVAAGESVGSLDQTLEKLAALLGKQSRLKKQLLTALLYPMVLGGFSIIVIFCLLLFVIPSLEMLFEGQTVNRFTGTVLSVSRFLKSGWVYYFPLLGAFGVAGWYALRKRQVRLWFHGRALATPLLKTLIIQSSLARFCQTMGTLLEGGVSIINALQIARKVMRNPLLEEVVAQAETRIVEGSLLSHELKKSPWIPSLVTRMLYIGEEGGNSVGMLKKIAAIYEDEVEKSLNRLTALAQPVILLIMGGIVGIIMLAVLLPLTDVSAFT